MTSCHICDRICERDLIRTIINIWKCRLEIFNAVHLENAWCLFYAALHKSVVIQDNSMDVLLNGLLDKFPTPRVIDQGWWGATVVAG